MNPRNRSASRPFDPPGAGYAVLVPVKPPAVAKSRLGGLGERARVDLAEAFAADTVSAVQACSLVVRVLVVTDDHRLAGRLSELGADVIPDGASDLNRSLVQAAAEVHRRDPQLGLVALCADLPALRPDELAVALQAIDPARMSFVADQERTGTTAVVAPTLETFQPSFGASSRRHHLGTGAHEVDGVDVPGLRRDVDDPTDLAAAMALGVGPRTAMVTAGLRLEPRNYPAPMQATVSAFDPTARSGRVLLDDGLELPFEASALDGSGLRLLRPGQRVQIETAGVGPAVDIVRLQILTLR